MFGDGRYSQAGMNRGKRTSATIRRLDGTYTASFAPPMLSLAGAIPDVMKVVYGTFVERYPGIIRPDALRAINTNVLAEVGVSINLLDNRTEILLRVDQIGVRAVNLRNDQEVRFVADCILITHSTARKLAPAITIGSTIINISTWIGVDGGARQVEKILSTACRPSRPNSLKEASLGAKSVAFLPRVLLGNDQEGWKLTVAAEKSEISEADLFVVRQYIFGPPMRYSDFEQQFAFILSSTKVISEWLGLDMVEANAAG
jgi:hypothetical protein